ncbi:MAG: outer membrane protein [Reyranellales bacterium]
MTIAKQSLITFVLLGIAVPAGAQTTTSLPPYANRPTWTGFYIGAAFGAGAMVDRVDTSVAGAGFTIDGAGGSGVLGSIYGGIDYRILPRAVVGLLAEVSWAGFQSSASAQVLGANAGVTTRADLGWAALARAGVLASPSTLLYLIGGYTGQNFHTDGFAAAGGATANFSNNATLNGWTVGGGLESMLWGGWSGKLEYRYSQFERRLLPGTSIGVQPATQVVRAGLTYHFGGLGAAEADEPAAPPVATNWTGFYAGVAGGGGAGVNRASATFGGASAALDGGGQSLLGSVFGGFDYQFAPQALVGVMGDFTWASLQSTASVFGGGNIATVSARADRTWSAMARLGFLPTPSTLVYAAGGYAGENINATATAAVGGASAFASQDMTVQGWTVGPGIETVVTGGWTTRLEYRYSQFEQKQVLSGISVQPSSHTIRAGLSYKFGVGAPPPKGSE